MDKINIEKSIDVMKNLAFLSGKDSSDECEKAIAESIKALEKQMAKKPKKSGVTDSNGIFHAVNGINGVPYDLCPNCEINLCTDGMFGGNKGGIKYCKNCGQKIDWS